MGISETWDSRELPILQAVYTAREEGEDDLGMAAKTAVPDLDDGRFLHTLQDLHRGGFLDVALMAGDSALQSAWIRDITPEGLRVVGAWPSGSLADQFLNAIQREAEAEEDPKKKETLMLFLKTAYNVGTGVLAELLVRVATRGL